MTSSGRYLLKKYILVGVTVYVTQTRSWMPVYWEHMHNVMTSCSVYHPHVFHVAAVTVPNLEDPNKGHSSTDQPVDLRCNISTYVVMCQVWSPSVLFEYIDAQVRVARAVHRSITLPKILRCLVSSVQVVLAPALQICVVRTLCQFFRYAPP